MANTILMIHGLWGGGWYWENYQNFFNQHGWHTIAPDLPFHGRAIKKPNPKLATASLNDYVNAMVEQISQLDEKPIIMGHSMGGLVAQILASRGLAEKLILLTPASPAGIWVLSPSVLRTFLPILCCFGFWHKILPHHYKSSCYSVMNNIPDEAKRRGIASQMGYESGRVIFEIGLWLFDKQKTTHINNQDIQCPTLIISAGKDRIVPASVVKKVYQKYQHCAKYHCFEEYAHWVVGEEGWEKIAQYCQQWLLENN